MAGFPPRVPGLVRLLVGGDLMLGRGIDSIRPIHNNPDFGKQDARQPSVTVAWAEAGGHRVPRNATAHALWGEALEPLLDSQPDLTLFNLETAVTSRDCWVAKTYNFRMHPAGLDVLEAAGISCVSLANNHVLDFGLPGLLDTIQALESQGISVAGAGLNARAAAAPAPLLMPGGQRVLLFGMACCNAGCRAWEAALSYRPGIALLPNLELATANAVCRLIQHYRQPDDLVVISIHWGGNWPEQVPDLMRAFAHHLVQQAGVHLVHGHSSHWPMEVEQIGDALVLYGCGDVLNDYEGRPDQVSLRGDLGALYAIDFQEANLRLAGWHKFIVRRQAFCLKLVDLADQQLVDSRLRINL
ncbi:CapA family protein [Synechococcus sp. 1G10]|uniref:CapA family protein n=1 Tax=Synechococcus sp. 1G10 TaxID=2025605 RepID=UPI000B99988B|nr:CapA family protein [Synechococcus sp. 1G10]